MDDLPSGSLAEIVALDVGQKFGQKRTMKKPCTLFNSDLKVGNKIYLKF